MKCPKCESENTQRLEIAFSHGTQNITSSTRSTGIGFGGGSVGIGFGKAKTSGQSQSVLAQQVAPPTKKSYKWPAIATFFGVLQLFMSVASLNIAGLIIAAPFLGLGGYRMRSIFKFNSLEWPKMYQHWAESWICHKCGDIYREA